MADTNSQCLKTHQFPVDFSTRLVVNQIIDEASGEAYWKARVESQGKAESRTGRMGMAWQKVRILFTGISFFLWRETILFSMGSYYFWLGKLRSICSSTYILSHQTFMLDSDLNWPMIYTWHWEDGNFLSPCFIAIWPLWIGAKYYSPPDTLW